MKTVGLWLVQAYNEWEGGEAGKDLGKDVLPVNLTKMTEEQSDDSLLCDWVKSLRVWKALRYIFSAWGQFVLKLSPE